MRPKNEKIISSEKNTSNSMRMGYNKGNECECCFKVIVGGYRLPGVKLGSEREGNGERLDHVRNREAVNRS